MVRIQANLRSGDGAAAAALANRFLKEHPQSPYAARVRTMLAESQAPR